MDIGRAIRMAMTEKSDKHWDKVYVAVDFHGTVVKNSRDHDVAGYQLGAREALRMMTDRRDIVLILWTGSHPEQISAATNSMLDDGIRFDYVNCNPEVGATERFCPDGKMYFNVGIDDRFGFDAGGGDWLEVVKALCECPEECKCVKLK